MVLFHIGHRLNYPALAGNSGLGVDLFFCLSGFVVPLAYERRFRTDLSVLRFMEVRLIRLMPLIVLGTLLSASYALSRSYVLRGSVSYQELILATVLGVTNIPFLIASAAIGGPQVFSLNGPQYSLFLEIVVNILWAGIRSFAHFRSYLFIFVVCLVALSVVGLGGDDAATFWTGFPTSWGVFLCGHAHFPYR